MSTLKMSTLKEPARSQNKTHYISRNMFFHEVFHWNFENFGGFCKPNSFLSDGQQLKVEVPRFP